MINNFKKHHLAEVIDTERHRIFMKEAAPHLIGGLCTGLLLFFIYFHSASFFGRTIWLIAQALLLASTITFYSIYFFLKDKLSLKQWERIIFLVSLLWGCIWALPAHLLLQTNDILDLAALLVVIITLAITPAPAMVQYPMAYLVFMTLPLLSLLVKLLALELSLFLALLVPFFWLTVIIYGWRLHHTMIDSIRLRLEIDESRKEAEIATIAKSKFLAAASHDIRQPLQAVHLFLDAMIEKLNIDRTEPLLIRLESGVNSMSELLNTLLDVSKLDAEIIIPKPKVLELTPFLLEIVRSHEPIAHQGQLTLKTKLNHSYVNADAHILKRIVDNLLTNAIRYTREGSISLTTYTQKNMVIIEVSDTGCGIPLHEQKEIFTEFYQAGNPERDQQKGLGLGLAIVKRLCKLHAWNLSLDSQVNKGSCFTLEIPIHDVLMNKNPNSLSTLSTNNIEMKRQSNSIAAFGFRQSKVVIIEDNENIRVGLASLLRGWQCDTQCYNSSEEALHKLAPQAWKPCLILSDFRLANNKTGVDAINQVQQLYACNIPAIIITGDTDPTQIQHAKDSGFTVLHKPIKAAQLRMAVGQKLSIHSYQVFST